MTFRFRSENVASNNEWAEPYKIAVDIGSQLVGVNCQLYEIARLRGIHIDDDNDQTLMAALEEDMRVINDFTDRVDGDKNFDMKLSTLIGYANVFGGIVKIQIEFDDEEKTELL